MSFTVSSWKVEFFGSKRKGDSSAEVTARIDRVFNYLRDEIDTDIYAIYEANGSQVFTHATTMFPDYTWKITEGSGSQDILVGSRRPIFITDRTEFGKGFNGPLRPGALVTLNDDGETYSMLFLHLKAADKAIDFGVRVHQHERARSLRKALDKAAPAGERANFIVAGDLNSVGLDLTFSDADVELVDEVKRLRTMYGSRFDHMPVRDKTREHTFWNGPGTSDPPSDIDHVAAAERIQFAPVNGAEVEVKGWPEEPSPEAMGNWIGDFSDHALLRFEVTGVQ
jgi:hypothetical protein